jgi:hypothetical protein
LFPYLSDLAAVNRVFHQNRKGGSKKNCRREGAVAEGKDRATRPGCSGALAMEGCAEDFAGVSFTLSTRCGDLIAAGKE